MLLPESEEFFAGVRGRQCWSVIGGRGTGSIISLAFGAKVRMKQPLRNPALSLEERLFEGERALIVYCDWRLETSNGILSSSQSTTAAGDIDLSGFEDVKNRVVKDLRFSSRLHDLRVEFDNGITLSVFCDLPLTDEVEISNYIMFNPSTCVAVTTRGGLKVEKR